MAGSGAGPGRAWVDHLRSGGTTPWREWSTLHPTGAPDDGHLPGAQQLEVLRRLNVLRPGGAGPALAEEVLGVSAPGRASLDLPLVGLPSRAYGAAPVDPADLPATTLLRVATGVVADRLVAAAADVTPARGPGVAERLAARLPRRVPFRLVGPSARVDPVRTQVRALGRPPGGRDALHLVLGADAGRLVTDAWTSRAFEGTAPPWSDWLRTWVERDTCPPRADLVAIADGWAARRGADRVAVVLDVALLRDELDLDGSVHAAPPVPAAAAEVVRLVASVLGVLVDRPRRTRLLTDHLAPRLAAAEGPPLVVGEAHREWLVRHGRALGAGLRRGGYRVLGPSDLLEDPPRTDGVAAPDPDEALRLALACLDAWSDGSHPDG